MTSAARRVRVRIIGRVQGVFFRACTADEAERLSLSGWVRNRADGSVEAVFEGEPAAVEKMISWCHRGSPHALVTRVLVSEEAPSGGRTGFRIRYH